MIALALLLLVVAVVVVVAVIALGSSQPIVFDTFAGTVRTQPVWVFVLGAVVAVLVVFALSLLRRGTSRKVSQRRELRRLRRVEREAVVTDTGSDTGATEVVEERHVVRDDRPADRSYDAGYDRRTADDIDLRGEQAPDRTVVRDVDGRPTETGVHRSPE